MKRSAIIGFLAGCCAFSFSQVPQFSRAFQTIKTNVPIAIINSQPEYFYVLRYNKGVHDFTIEKRAKPTAEIIGFTPLKLDSVNNSWFDYEKIDYLFYEHHRQLYFVFEKLINSKNSLYLKVIDTLSKSSGFIELASYDFDKTLQDFSFSFKKTDNDNILIVATHTYLNGTVKKTAQLYDIEERRMVWTKKLPIENAVSGYSSAFECNTAGDLFYVLTQSRTVGYTRKYIHQMEVNVPILFHDAVNLVSYQGIDQFHKTPLLTNISHLNSVHILTSGNQVIVQANIGLLCNDSVGSDLYFFSKKLSADLRSQYYTITSPLADSLREKLTFYDGSDFKQPGDKDYAFLQQFSAGQINYQVSERKEDYYYKELLVWQTDLQTGQVTHQSIVPRKVLSFKNRTRFKKVGEAMFVFAADKLNVFVLEAAANFKSKPSKFVYHRFKKETNLWRANVMMYTIQEGRLEKTLVFHNAEYDMVPLSYSSTDQSDVVFYLNDGKYEKFAILKLNPS